jgi:hypothetical protein
MCQSYGVMDWSSAGIWKPHSHVSVRVSHRPF